MCTGANASIGVRNSHGARGTAGYRARGQHGIKRENVAGHHLRNFLGGKGPCAAQAIFRKMARGGHASARGTWQNFRTGAPYQPNHFFVKQTDMKRVRDAGPVNWSADSDHWGIILRMGICKGAVRRRTARSTGRVDRTLLRSAALSKKWRAALSRYAELLSGTGSKLAVPEAAMVTKAKEGLLYDRRRRGVAHCGAGEARASHREAE